MVLLSFCLIFSQFQPGIAYKSVFYKKKRVMHESNTLPIDHTQYISSQQQQQHQQQQQQL